MATARKPAVDPLVEELPPVPEEPKPRSATEIRFDVEIEAYVVNGTVFHGWKIIDHNAKAYVGNYVGQETRGFASTKAAEQDAALYVDRIRHTVDLKLNLPESYRISL